MAMLRELAIRHIKDWLQPLDGQKAGNRVQTNPAVSLREHPDPGQELAVAETPVNRSQRLLAGNVLCGLVKVRFPQVYEPQQICAIA